MTEQQTPTPIDPADIRPGDVFRLTYEATCDRVDRHGIIVAANGYSFSPGDDIDTTWYLVHRPDPDAEAVEALGDAFRDGFNIELGEAKETFSEKILHALREQGWDVTRRQP